jgi:hypothetical protein
MLFKHVLKNTRNRVKRFPVSENFSTNNMYKRVSVYTDNKKYQFKHSKPYQPIGIFWRLLFVLPFQWNATDQSPNNVGGQMQQ